MTKPKRTIVPRRAAVVLALLASASNQTLLAALTVGSLNAGLLFSASAATCVTSDATFADVVSGVGGAPGITVVSAVTPTMFERCQRRANHARVSADRREPQHDIGHRRNGVSGQTGTAVTELVLDIRHRF